MKKKTEDFIANLIIYGGSIAIVMLGSILMLIFIPKIQKQDIKEENVVQECQQDWAVTSKYDWILGEYKTISKCSKCGREI